MFRSAYREQGERPLPQTEEPAHSRGRALTRANSRPLLVTLVALGEKRNMEWHFGGRLLLGFSRRVGAERSALRIDARPSAARALEDVREHALLIHLTTRHFVVEHIRAVGDGGVAEHADSDHFLLQVQCLVFAANQIGQLLIARGDVSTRRYIDEER